VALKEEENQERLRTIPTGSENQNYILAL